MRTTSVDQAETKSPLEATRGPAHILPFSSATPLSWGIPDTAHTSPGVAFANAIKPFIVDDYDTHQTSPNNKELASVFYNHPIYN